MAYEDSDYTIVIAVCEMTRTYDFSAETHLGGIEQLQLRHENT